MVKLLISVIIGLDLSLSESVETLRGVRLGWPLDVRYKPPRTAACTHNVIPYIVGFQFIFPSTLNRVNGPSGNSNHVARNVESQND